LDAVTVLGDELATEVAGILRATWSERDGQLVPEPESLRLGNDAVKLDGTVLYADMTSSTELVDSRAARFAGKVYKSYLTCAARIIKARGGVITAYDGDRVMAVFLGNGKNSAAATAALKINHAVSKIVNPALRQRYGEDTYQLSHVIGIDTGPLFVARIGVRNNNDLVWVGRAANYAAKLCALDTDSSTTFITDDVFVRLNASAKYGGDPKRLMWKPGLWSDMDDMRIHSSAWRWAP
jgi:class 3 adenylate cyclase